MEHVCKFHAAAVVAAGALATHTAFAATPEKKIVLYGWDVGEASLETIFTNANKFAETGLDGIAISIKGNRMDLPRKSQTRDFAFVDPKWTKEEFAHQVGLLRELTANPGLRHCYLQVDWSQPKRLRWDDDAAWENAAHNMGILAWIAKEGHLDGMFIDPEDYQQTHQFEPCPEEGDFATISRLARKRGAQIISAMAAENPNLHLVFFWLLSWSTRWTGAPETDLAAYVAWRQDPWPSFVNGMLDALPSEMRLADGNEFGYLFSAEKNNYIMDNWRQRQVLVQLIAPENIQKFRSNVQVSSGHYLDCYSNKDGHWYKPPLNGSRLARFEDDLHQGLASADEAVWLFGERRQIIKWEGNAARWNGVKTWEEELPGFADVMRRTRNPRKWAADKIAAMRADGTLTNLFAGKAFGTWQAEKSKGTLTVGDDGVLSATGVKDGCFLGSVTDVKPGQWYLAEFDVKGPTDPRCGIQWKRGEAYDWDMPARYPVFTPLEEDGRDAPTARPQNDGRFVETSLPDNPIASGRDAPTARPQDGWRHATIIARVPHNVDTMMLHLSPKHKAADAQTTFRKVAIYRLD